MPAHFTPSPRIRRSPFFDSTVSEGVTSFTVYNHMYMPTGYGDPIAEYWRLLEGVTMWDVACERQVEIQGPDAGRLAQILCPRKLGDMQPGQGYYVAVCDHNGVLLNDPILLKLAEDCYWFSIADGDLMLWVKAVAAERSLDVRVSEPDVSPLAVQGPKAIGVMVDLFGEKVRQFRRFRFRETEIEGIPILLQRSGWSRQGGFELYLRDAAKGRQLWNLIREAGAPYAIAPGCPNAIERVESGLLSYRGDTDAWTNPFEVRLGKYVHLDAPDDTIGIRALRQIAREGPKRHQVGVVIDVEKRLGSFDLRAPVFKEGAQAGMMTANAFSPRMDRNIGLCLVSTAVQPGDRVSLDLPNGQRAAGQVCELPFI